MYTTAADNSLNPKTRYNVPLTPSSAGALPWYQPFFYQLGLVVLVCVFLMLCWLWPNDAASPHQPIVPTTPPTPTLQGTQTVCWPDPATAVRPVCARSHTGPRAASGATRADAPDEPPATHRRYLAALLPPWGLSLSRLAGAGNLRANGHPNGGPWRQLHCTACEGYFPEHHGTIYGKQAAVELIVHVLACLAEGLGIRATARVFEVDANTVLHWLIEAAEHLRPFLPISLCPARQAAATR